MLLLGAALLVAVLALLSSGRSGGGARANGSRSCAFVQRIGLSRVDDRIQRNVCSDGDSVHLYAVVDLEARRNTMRGDEEESDSDAAADAGVRQWTWNAKFVRDNVYDTAKAAFDEVAIADLKFSTKAPEQTFTPNGDKNGKGGDAAELEQLLNMSRGGGGVQPKSTLKEFRRKFKAKFADKRRKVLQLQTAELLLDAHNATSHRMEFTYLYIMEQLCGEVFTTISLENRRGRELVSATYVDEVTAPYERVFCAERSVDVPRIVAPLVRHATISFAYALCQCADDDDTTEANYELIMREPRVANDASKLIDEAKSNQNK